MLWTLGVANMSSLSRGVQRGVALDFVLGFAVSLKEATLYLHFRAVKNLDMACKCQ